MHKMKKSSGRSRLLYLYLIILIALASIYLFADIDRYVLLLSSGFGGHISSDNRATAVTGTRGGNFTGPVSFRDETALSEGMTLGVTNASGAISIDARRKLERCYRSDGLERCLTLQKKEADQPGAFYYAGAFQDQLNDNNAVAVVEAAEGSMDFRSIKDAIQWIDSEKNRSFNFVYDNNGLTAGWYRTAVTQGRTLIKAQVWRLLIDGALPEMLPGSEPEKMSIAKRAVSVSGAAPPLPEKKDDRDGVRSPGQKKIALPIPPTEPGREYCSAKESEEYGEYIELNLEKEGISVLFTDKKNDQMVNALGLSFLSDTVNHWVAEKDNINSRNTLPIKDRTKVHVSFDREAYYIPDDIAEWIGNRKHFIIKGKFFKYKDVDYLYLSAGLDAKAFVKDGGGDDDVLYKTEALYMLVNDRYGRIIVGTDINILKIDNNLLIAGVRNDGYEGSNGQVIAFDGNRSSLLCNWGFGM